MLLLSAEFWQLVKTLPEHKYSYQNLVPHLLSAAYSALLGRREEIVALGRRKLYHFPRRAGLFIYFILQYMVNRWTGLRKFGKSEGKMLGL